MAELVVYELADPCADTVFYVGRGRPARASTHVRATRNWVRKGRPTPRRDQNIHKLRKIAKLLAAGVEPVVRLVAEGLTFEESCLLEQERIAMHGLENLTNCAAGGDGPGYHSDASRRKMSEAHKGVPKSAEHKLAIGLGRRGKRHTAGAKRRMAAAQRGRRHTVEHRRANSAGNRGRAKHPLITKRCRTCGEDRAHRQRLRHGQLAPRARCTECEYSHYRRTRHGSVEIGA